MRAAVFGPRPGRRMKSTTSCGNERLPLRERLDLALLDDLDDLLLDRLPDPLELLRPAVERELRDRARRVAHPCGRPPVRDHPERLGSFELQQVGEELELLRDLRVLRQRRHVADHMRVPRYAHPVPGATICLPTYNERENLESMLRALAPLGVSVLVVDDNSPDGTGDIADRLAGELGFVSVLHRPEKQGLGPAYLAGFRRALADGADYVLEMDCDFSHKPGGRSAPDRRLRERRRSRTRLTVRPRRRHGELGPDPAARSRSEDRSTPARCSG